MDQLTSFEIPTSLCVMLMLMYRLGVFHKQSDTQTRTSNLWATSFLASSLLGIGSLVELKHGYEVADQLVLITTGTMASELIGLVMGGSIRRNLGRIAMDTLKLVLLTVVSYRAVERELASTLFLIVFHPFSFIANPVFTLIGAFGTLYSLVLLSTPL